MSRLASSPSGGGKCQNSNSPADGRVCAPGGTGLRFPRSSYRLHGEGHVGRTDGGTSRTGGLCLPGNGRDMAGQSGIAFPQRSRAGSRYCHAASISMARGGIAGPGKLAAPHRSPLDARPARRPARPSVACGCRTDADLRDERDDHSELDPPQALKRGDGWHQQPIGDRFLKNLPSRTQRSSG